MSLEHVKQWANNAVAGGFLFGSSRRAASFEPECPENSTRSVIMAMFLVGCYVNGNPIDQGIQEYVERHSCSLKMEQGEINQNSRRIVLLPHQAGFGAARIRSGGPESGRRFDFG